MPLRAAYRWFSWLASRRKWTFVTLIAMKGVAIGLLILSMRHSREASNERRIAYEALVGLERFLSTLRDAETGQRGYLLTGDPSYLAPFNSAVTQFGNRIVIVRKYKPFPASRIDFLETIGQAKLDELRRTIDLYEGGRAADALAVVRTDEGKRLMEAIRMTIETLQRDERERVNQSEVSLAIATNVTFGGFVVMMTLTAITLVGLIVAYSREEKARRIAEAETARAASRYSAINRAAPGAIITANDKGIIDEWNPAAEAIFGWPSEEICGQQIQTIIPERFHKAHTESMRAAMASGHLKYPDKTWELWGLRKDGTEFPAEIFVDVFTVEDVPHCVGIVRDITPRRHMEAQLNAKQAELQRSNDELQQFAYVASHDLQEPSRVMATYARKLQEKLDGTLDEQGRRYVHYIVEGANRSQAVIQDLLAFSRITTQARPSKRVDICDLINEVMADLRDQIEREAAIVEIQPCELTVLGDPIQLHQVFQNLLSNAIKFHRPGEAPKVSLTWEEHPSTWHFLVQDNGIGIAREDLPKLFFMFTRLHARGEYEGTGIGLTICKKIIERHGGAIWIESAPGTGSTFHFTIPKEGKTDVR